MPNNARQNRIIAVFGRKGSGKSTLVKKIVRRSRRLLVIDPMREYENGQVVFDRQAVFEILTRRKTFRVIFRPAADEGDYHSVDWAAQLAIAVGSQRGNMTIAIDEIDNYSTSAVLTEPLRQLIHYGRHYGVSIIFAARMPQRIRTDWTAQADDIIVFQMQGRPLQYLKDFTDDPQIEDKVKALGQYKYFSINSNFSLDKLQGIP